MKKLILVAALAAACFTARAADAQSTVVLPQVKNAGGSNVPSQASVLTGADGLEKGTSSNPVYVTGGGGGGGSTITAPAGTSSTTAVPVQSVTGGALALDASVLALFKAGQLIGNTAFGISGLLPGFASTPTFNIGTGGAGTAGTPLYTTSSTPSVGAPGSAAPANAQQVGGVGPNGNLRALATGTLGGLAPSQYTYVDSQAVAIVANAAAVQIDSDEDTGTSFVTMTTSHRANRIYFTVQLATAATANFYICASVQAANCSATRYTFMIPSGATMGTFFNPPGGTTAPLYGYSTAAVTVKVSSQVPQ